MGGACRLNADGTGEGTHEGDDPDFIKHVLNDDAVIDEVKKAEDLEHCKDICKTMTDHTCYGIEYVSGDTFDYCEVWIKPILGHSDSTGHLCDLYTPSDDHDDHDHDHDHETGELEVTTTTNSSQVVSSTIQTYPVLLLRPILGLGIFGMIAQA